MISLTASSSTLRLWSPAQLKWLLSVDLAYLIVVPLLFIFGVSNAIQQADNYHNPHETNNPSDSGFAAIALSIAVAPPAFAFITSVVQLILYSNYTLYPVTVLVSSIIFFLGWVVVAFTTGWQSPKGSWGFHDGYAGTPLTLSPGVTYYYVGAVPSPTTPGAPPPTSTPYSVVTNYPYKTSYLPQVRGVHLSFGVWIVRLVLVSLACILQVAYMTVSAIAVDANRKARREQNKAQVTYIEPANYEDTSTAVQAPSTTQMHNATSEYSPVESRHGSLQSYASEVDKEKEFSSKDLK